MSDPSAGPPVPAAPAPKAAEAAPAAAPAESPAAAPVVTPVAAPPVAGPAAPAEREEGADPLERAATPERIAALLEAGVLDERGHAWALAAIGRRPNAAAWRRFLLVHLLFLGVAGLAAGAGFFIAASWGRLGTLVKLALVAAPMGLLALGAARAGFERLAGRAAALLSALLAGPLLALLGQSYPTGADVYDLLLAWSAANALFAAATREPALLLLELLLLDATIGARLGEVGGRDVWTDGGFLCAITLLHTVACVAWEVLRARGVRGFHGRAFPRLAAAGALGIVVALTIPFIVADRSGREIGPIALAFSLGGIGALVAVHSRRIPDLAQLALAGAGAATLIAVGSGRLFYGGLDFNVGSLFLHGATIAGTMTALALWLLEMRKRHRALGAGGDG